MTTYPVELKNRPWTDSPFFSSALEVSELDPEMKKIVAFFAEHGYVVVDPQISDATIENVNASLRDLFVPTYEPYYADTTRIQDAWWFNEHVKEIAVSPRKGDLSVDSLVLLWIPRPAGSHGTTGRP